MVGSRRLSRLTDRASRAVSGALPQGLPIVVALSGGADSAVLAWVLKDLEVPCRAIHIHHGWPASERLSKAAEAVAAEVGIQLTRIDVDTDAPGSPEGVAREARYTALESALVGEEYIATAHTLDDQAETVVGNLMGGSGFDGRAGIHRSRGRLVRPLLDLVRAEVRELATLAGLPFVDDPANIDERFRRVRIRRALAEWEARLAPGIARRLAATADLVSGELELLDDQMAGVRIDESDEAVRISTGILRTLPDAAARRVVREALRRVGDGHPGTRRDVEDVLSVAFGGQPTEVSSGHRVARVGASVQIGRPHQDTIEGRTELGLSERVQSGGWVWTANQYEGRPASFPLTEWEQVFDASLFEGDPPVTIRAANEQDVITIRDGHKSVFDAMSEVGVGADERKSWPILDVDGDVLWIPGVRRSYSGWVSDGTRRYVVVSVQREERWKPVAY